MSHGVTRREWLAMSAAASLPEIPMRDGVPRVDYHAHPSQAISVDTAIQIATERGVTFGVLQHAGNRRDNRYWGLVSNDSELNAWIKSLEGKPVFKAIQAELTDWPSCFSKDAIAKLDYVLTDALTMRREGGGWIHIWTREFELTDAEKWMDRYVDYHVEIMAKQPIDIIANPTYLPDAMMSEYDRLWTGRRMRTIVEAAVKYGVAVEINSRFRVPRLPFLEMAKGAGARFSFGSNMHTPDTLGDIGYCIEMYRRLGLSASQFWRPAPPGKKPVQTRTLA